VKSESEVGKTSHSTVSEHLDLTLHGTGIHSTKCHSVVSAIQGTEKRQQRSIMQQSHGRCKTVRPMLSVPLSCLCPVCNVGVLWPNGWMDQDAKWYGGKPRPRPHCVRWGPSIPHFRDLWTQLLPRTGLQQPTHFLVHFALARSPISATAELLSLF